MDGDGGGEKDRKIAKVKWEKWEIVSGRERQGREVSGRQRERREERNQAGGRTRSVGTSGLYPSHQILFFLSIFVFASDCAEFPNLRRSMLCIGGRGYRGRRWRVLTYADVCRSMLGRWRGERREREKVTQ
jgi:hypothetical protein